MKAEKIFKYRDTTQTFERILAETMHKNLYRFEIIRDKNLFLNFYENKKIRYHFDVDNNTITKYSYNHDLIKYIKHLNDVLDTYEYTSYKRIKENLQLGYIYHFELDNIKISIKTDTITKVYQDGTIEKELIICD